MRIGDSGAIALLLQSFARIAGEGGDQAAGAKSSAATAPVATIVRPRAPMTSEPAVTRLRVR